uniref:(northern house mosquito) hypothetical protein n=1 Tax=Culex pipiens TaxID=7175 RepID=A0A8D8C1Z5_CULPI
MTFAVIFTMLAGARFVYLQLKATRGIIGFFPGHHGCNCCRSEASPSCKQHRLSRLVRLLFPRTLKGGTGQTVREAQNYRSALDPAVRGEWIFRPEALHDDCKEVREGENHWASTQYSYLPTAPIITPSRLCLVSSRKECRRRTVKMERAIWRSMWLKLCKSSVISEWTDCSGSAGICRENLTQQLTFLKSL